MYAYDIGRIKAEPHGALDTTPNAFSPPTFLAKGWEGKYGAKWLFLVNNIPKQLYVQVLLVMEHATNTPTIQTDTLKHTYTPMGPAPGPPPPCHRNGVCI